MRQASGRSPRTLPLKERDSPVFSWSLQTFRFTLISLVLCFLGVASFARNAVWSDGVSLYEDVVRKTPNKSRAWDHLGVAFYLRSDYPNAIAAYDRAIKLDPYLSINPYRNLARLYVDIGEYDRAVQLLTWAMSIDAGNYELYTTRGMAYHKKNEFPQAIADFSRALDLERNNPAIYVDRGLAYEAAGRIREAVRDFDEACSRGRSAACEKSRALRPDGGRPWR